MLIFKVAKFVLKHPLLTHGAVQLVHKNYVPQRRHPYETESSRSRIPSGGADPGIISATVSITSIVFAAGPASGTPVQTL